MLKYVDRKFSEESSGEKYKQSDLKQELPKWWPSFSPDPYKIIGNFCGKPPIHYLHKPLVTIYLDLYFQRCIKFLPMRNKKFPWMLFFAGSTTSQTSLTQSLFPIDILHIRNWILTLYVNYELFLLQRKRTVHALETSMERTNNLNMLNLDNNDIATRNSLIVTFILYKLWGKCYFHWTWPKMRSFPPQDLEAGTISF